MGRWNSRAAAILVVGVFVLGVGNKPPSLDDPSGWLLQDSEAQAAPAKKPGKPAAKPQAKAPQAKAPAAKPPAKPSNVITPVFKSKPSDPAPTDRGVISVEAGGAKCDARIKSTNSDSSGKACADTSSCCVWTSKSEVFGQTVSAKCVDLKNDRFNCGGCGRECPGALECREGVCVCAVYEHEKDVVRDLCEGACVDIAGADVNNCGACGKTCKEGQICDAGKCQRFSCDRGSTMCGGHYCADLKNDDADCGSCGHQCTDGFRCVGGRCRP